MSELKSVNRLTAVSLYSGADNLGDGFIQAGGQIKVCVEQNKDCCETIKLNHPDIEVINGQVSDYLTTLPKADCVIGGPPCQDFSRAKSNRTFNLCEVNNFKKAVSLCKSKYYFMENVPDLVKVNPERNYLINCADYGVPQTRIRRIFTNLPMPNPTHSKNPTSTLFGTSLKKWVSVREALGLDGIIEDRKTVFGEYGKFRQYSTDKPSNTIVTDSRQWFISNTGHGTQNRENITRTIDEPADTITNASAVQITDYPIKSRKKIRNRNQQTEGYCRKLTNEELAILQGFRKGFKFYGSKSSVRKQIGNALPAIIPKSFFQQVAVLEKRHLE